MASKPEYVLEKYTKEAVDCLRMKEPTEECKEILQRLKIEYHLANTRTEVAFKPVNKPSS